VLPQSAAVAMQFGSYALAIDLHGLGHAFLLAVASTAVVSAKKLATAVNCACVD
jgi:hypothetical protein